MRPSSRPLINFTMLMRVMGWLMMIEAVFMLVPTATCLIYDEADWLPFGVTAAVTFVIGALLSAKLHTGYTGMGKREGFLLTSMVWVVFSVFGMMPFIFCSTPMTVSDAFFESMSGFTTTGASVITSSDSFSHGVLIWRAMMQWIGGMGIILFTLAVIPMLNYTGGMHMFNSEVTGITHDKIRPRISQTAKSLWQTYIVLTIALTLLLWVGPMDFFDSICHAFGTISTGGYSTRPGGVSDYNSVYAEVIITVFMFLGGVNFGLIYRAALGRFDMLRRDEVFRTYVLVIALMYVMFVSAIVINDKVYSIKSVTIDPLFQIISTLTSTGYSVTDFESWGYFTLSLVFMMMFFGACAGSTSGGAKLDRMLYLIKNCHNELYRCINPRAILSVRISGRVINPDLVNKVIAFLLIYMMLVVIGGVALTAMHLPPVDAFFSSFSCVSNTGLGAGVTGYGNSFDIVPDAGKWVLSALMLIGRLEIFTVLIVFMPSFWRK